MKKLVLCILFFTTVLLFPGCDQYYGTRPYDYGDAIWICEEPYMVYSITSKKCTDENGNEYDMIETSLKIEGDDNTYDIIHSYGGEAYIDNINETDLTSPWLLEGDCKYGKNKFIIVIHKGTDLLFGGKYYELVFVRQDTTNQ